MMDESTNEVQVDVAGTDEAVPTSAEVVALPDVLEAIDRAADLAAERVAAETHDLYATNAELYDSSRDAAVTAAAGAAAEQVSESIETTASNSADDIVNRVGDAISAELDTQTLDGTTVVATISEDQWTELQTQMQMNSTLSVLSLLVVALIVGVMLSRSLLERWRR